MVIQVNLDMKLILKHFFKNKLFIISLFDIFIIFWIVWFEKQIQYEPLLNGNFNIEERLIPLHKEIYNTIIITILVNIFILVFELKRICNRKIIKYDLKIAFIYLFFVTFCMLLGYIYISTKILLLHQILEI